MDELEGRQKVEILFALVMVGSAFAPFVKVPIIGGIAPFDIGWPGYAIACAGLVGLVGAALGSRWIPPLCAAAAILAVGGFLAWYTWEVTHLGHGGVGRTAGERLSRGMATAIMGASSLSFGWVVLLVAGVGCGIGQTVAELFLGSTPRDATGPRRVRREPHFGPAPNGSRRGGAMLVREPRGPGPGMR